MKLTLSLTIFVLSRIMQLWITIPVVIFTVLALGFSMYRRGVMDERYRQRYCSDCGDDREQDGLCHDCRAQHWGEQQ